MRTVKFELDGHIHYLAYNISAMMALGEFGDTEKIIDSVDSCIKSYVILAEQGELVRREFGYDHSEIPTEEYVRTIMSPSDIKDMSWAVLAAITAGLKREIDDESEQVIDLTLQKIEKKTGLTQR